MDHHLGEEGYGGVQIPRAGGPIRALKGEILRSRSTARGIPREMMSYLCSLNAHGFQDFKKYKPEIASWSLP